MTDRRVVVLVRGINVGRAKQVAMTDLRAAVEAAGGTGVRTYLRSGNAVADVDPAVDPDVDPDVDPAVDPAVDPDVAGGPAAFGPAVEQALLARTGVSARVLVVTAAHLRAVAAANPFPELAATGTQLHVLFCETPPDAADVQARLGLRHGDDELSVGDRVVYVAYRGGRSSGSPLEKVLPRLGVVTTARNWTTVQALLALVDA